MLRHLREQYRVARVNFLCNGQLALLHDHVHRECLLGTCSIIDPGPQNCKQMGVLVKGKTEVHWLATLIYEIIRVINISFSRYVNSKKNLFIEHTCENRMNKSFIDMFHCVKGRDTYQVEECKER